MAVYQIIELSRYKALGAVIGRGVDMVDRLAEDFLFRIGARDRLSALWSNYKSELPEIPFSGLARRGIFQTESGIFI